MWFFAFGFFIHVVLLLSIFDIYFKSPIVQDVTPYEPVHNPVADRLVLIVIDGLRAESLVNHTALPKLRAVASTHGMWGVSHTRVPTESRPGHVAMIAGFYEDPSAITKGWKTNPVDFDSVFNRTVYTWGWGSYDVLGIFAKGSVDDHIYIDKYDEYVDEAFSTNKNATVQDESIFRKFREFFKQAKTDKELNEKVNTKKIMFFLHLVGTDTAGHTHRPNSKSYFTSVKIVDDGIQEMVKLIKDFYNDDGRTTFIVTADHGMSDWGSHGAGSHHETETPFVIWGCGVKQIPAKPQSKDMVGLPEDRRHDILQADIAPLMSTVLSIPVPVNSIGRLPVEFLNMTLADRAKAIYGNSRQLASQYNTKRVAFEAHMIPFLYKPYKEFDERKYNELIEYTEKLYAKEKWDELILLSEEIMNLSISGLDYYHNYYQTVLLVLVTLIFIGWSFYLLNYLILNIRSQSSNISVDKNKSFWKNKALFTWLHIVFAFITMVPITLVYVQNLPIQYNIYFTLPVILLWLCMPHSDVWIGVIVRRKTTSNVGSILIQGLCYTLGSLAMGYSFTYRWMLSIPLIGMAIWPYVSSSRKHIPRVLLMIWPVCCILLSTFSFIPVVGKQVHVELVILAGMLKICFKIYSRNTLKKVHAFHENKTEIILVLSQLFVLVMALINIFVQSRRFTMGTPVIYWWQAEAWAIAVITFVFPIFHTTRVLCRLSAINMSVLTFYLLLSVAHEGLFLITLTITQSVWIMIEYAIVYGGVSKIYGASFDSEFRTRLDEQKSMLMSSDRRVNQHDFRRAFFFLVYIIISFFGTGNISSLNSFEVRWVTCFITSYRPFIIMGLILLKTLTPFLCVACAFRAVQQFTKAPLGLLNIIVLIYSNIMGIQLLFYVKNTGSWLEIGTSISQYVIVQVITIFIVIIDQLAKGLTEFSLSRAINQLVSGSKKYL